MKQPLDCFRNKKKITKNMSSSDEEPLTPNTLMEKNADKVVQKILPPKSKQIYLKTYEAFMQWRIEKQVNTFSESVFLTYFDELSGKLQPSTLWSIYSMLKSTINMKHNINIQTYTKLASLLKRLSTGHKSKKSKVLTAKQVETFLNTAPDEKYLATKVALIFGISGACRGIELANITLDDVKTDTLLQAINLPNTKTNRERTFVVKGEYLNIVKKYQALRPTNVQTNRFFLNYQNGKCTKQVIGRNKFAKLPKEIATYLSLDNPGSYTGHCFRRTSATLLADSGANITMLKRHGGWKSDQVAEGYIEDSVENKSKISEIITEHINLIPNEHINLTPNEAGPSTSKNYQPKNVILTEAGPSTYTEDSAHKTIENSKTNRTAEPSISTSQMNTVNIPGKTISLNIQNCSNFTLHF